MSEGKRFVDKCLTTDVIHNPWPHQILKDTLSTDAFIKLRDQCIEKLNYETSELHHIFPVDYKEYGIDFYNETLNICESLYENMKVLCGAYPKYRWFENLGVNVHISVTPPLPWQFHIHQEGIEKIWSSVTYVSPENNVGTKMYTAETKDAFVKEAKWKPNSTFIFCGQERKTWHSYESIENTNCITFNLFIMKYRKKVTFFPLTD